MPSKNVGKYDTPEKWLALKINIALSIFANETNIVARIAESYYICT